MTIGRAEDATISVNHNSVSRMHCEVHALGGRAATRSSTRGRATASASTAPSCGAGIVEPGDVIELGDVRFKFVGAGQIFRPTDSQQFTILSEGDADRGRRGQRRSAAVVPRSRLRRRSSPSERSGSWSTRAPDVDERRPAGRRGRGRRGGALARSRRRSTRRRRPAPRGDCDAAHDEARSGRSPESSPAARHARLQGHRERGGPISCSPAPTPRTTWSRKRALYQRVSQSVAVDAARRKLAADKLQQLDTSAGIGGRGADPAPRRRRDRRARHEVAAAPPPPAPARRRTRRPTPAPAAAAALPAAAPPPAPTPKPGVDDRERQLALQGTQDSKVLLKQQLEPRVFGGRASDTEIRLLISTCKDLGDKACVQQARAVWAQKKDQ